MRSKTRISRTMRGGKRSMRKRSSRSMRSRSMRSSRTRASRNNIRRQIGGGKNDIYLKMEQK